MKIDDLTLGQLRELQTGIFASTAQTVHPWQLGKCYLIRTVTMVDTGRLVQVTSQELVLEDAAWIADTGRFSDALKSLSFNEVEPFPDGQVIIGRGSIVDAVEIKQSPRSQPVHRAATRLRREASKSTPQRHALCACAKAPTRG